MRIDHIDRNGPYITLTCPAEELGKVRAFFSRLQALHPCSGYYMEEGQTATYHHIRYGTHGAAAEAVAWLREPSG